MPKNILNLIREENAANTVKLTSNKKLTIGEIVAVAHHGASVSIEISKEQEEQLHTIYQKMLEQVADGVPIYGTTASYGGQAGHVLTKGEKEFRVSQAKKLSEAIVHVDVSTGDPIPKEIVRAAMLLRLNMLLPGYSGVKMETLESLAELINSRLTPIVGRYGTLGASGDLAHNGRVLSVLRHLDNVFVWDETGTKVSAKSALEKIGHKPLDIDAKEGLAMVNGDNFSTATTALITHELTNLLFLNFGISAISIQALKGSIRDFHPLLAHVRPHPGQKFTADILRNLLIDSKLAYQELTHHETREPGVSVQDVYSIRCLPQYYGPDIERLDQIIQTIEINANAVSDNPLWTTPETVTEGEDPYQWVSGGNFLAMHMSESLDALRKLAIHMVKQNDRHLNRMVNPNLNNGLPANLSDEGEISRCTFKGLQTQMGMMEVYATILAAPVNTAFGVHEELNQDLTSHAMTSGIMTLEVMKLLKRAMATNLIASCQAIDLRGGPELLSPPTRPLYDWLRERVPYIKVAQPLGHYVEDVAESLKEVNLEEIVKRSSSE